MFYSVLCYSITPFPPDSYRDFPQGEGRAFRTYPVGKFSEGASFAGKPSRQADLFAKIAYQAIFTLQSPLGGK